MDIKRGKKRKLSRSQKSDYKNEMDRCDICKKWSNKEMVRCDFCKKWFHFRCVGVGPDVENEDWLCECCTERWFDMTVDSSVGDTSNITLLQFVHITILQLLAYLQKDHLAAMGRHAECLGPGKKYTKLPVAVKSVSRPVASTIPAATSNVPPVATSNEPPAVSSNEPPAASSSEPPAARSNERLAGQSNELPAGRSDIERRVDDMSKEVCTLKRVVASDQAGIRKIVELFTQTNVTGSQAALGVELEYNKTLPCVTLENLDILLMQVAIKTNYNQLKKYIKTIGGTNQDNAVKRALDTIMDRSVQKQLSWSGLRTKKAGFAVKYKLLVELIHESIQDTFKDYKRIDGERKLGSLLRSA